MKLAIYDVKVHCPDNWEDKDWSEEQQNDLDTAFSEAMEEFKDLVKKIHPALTVVE